MKPLKEIEEDDDEFEDAVLEKLQTIEEKIKKFRKEKKGKDSEDKQQQKTLTLIEEVPKFRKRYI